MFRGLVFPSSLFPRFAQGGRCLQLELWFDLGLPQCHPPTRCTPWADRPGPLCRMVGPEQAVGCSGSRPVAGTSAQEVAGLHHSTGSGRRPRAAGRSAAVTFASTTTATGCATMCKRWHQIPPVAPLAPVPGGHPARRSPGHRRPQLKQGERRPRRGCHEPHIAPDCLELSPGGR